MAIEKIMTPTLPEDNPTASIPQNDEEITVDEIGNVEVTLPEPTALAEAEAMGLLDDEMQNPDIDHESNLVEFMDQNDVNEVANTLWEGYTVDKESREEYDVIAEDGVNLLGLQYDESSQPFPGAA